MVLGDEERESALRTLPQWRYDEASRAISRGFRFRDMFGIIIGFTPTPAQHDVAVRVAHGFDDRCLAVSVDPDKMVRGSG